MLSLFFFFNDTATTEIYTLSLHDALPISGELGRRRFRRGGGDLLVAVHQLANVLPELAQLGDRSEEHTSELQSRLHLVCRLLLEKKKNLLKTTIIELIRKSRAKAMLATHS